MCKRFALFKQQQNLFFVLKKLGAKVAQKCCQILTSAKANFANAVTLDWKNVSNHVLDSFSFAEQTFVDSILKKKMIRAKMLAKPSHRVFGVRTKIKPKSILGFFVLIAFQTEFVIAQPLNALPSNGKVVAGAATISTANNTMTINQSTQRAVINWDSFNVGKNAQVNINTPGSNAATLNRVTGTAASQIDGALHSNGQIVLVNQNGVVFGRGAQVDAAAVTASTMNIADKDFMDGKSTFKGDGSGKIINKGTIQTNTADGFIALLAPEVRNQGYVLARMGGSVAMAGGEQITLNFQGNHSLVGVSVDKAAYKALIVNKRVIETDGGLIVLAAGAANQLMSSVVKNTGKISASSAVNNGGVIELVANTVTQAGTVEANSTSQNKTGGQINLVANDITITKKSTTTATGTAGGGQVNVGLAATAVTGGTQVNAQTPSANTATQNQAVVASNATQAASAKQMANTVTVEQGAVIDASATQNGNAGSIAIWSQLKTTVAGTLKAMGGALSGNGGFVETSSKGQVNLAPQLKVDTSAAKGRSGLWFLDPIDLIIDASAANVISLALANNNVSIAVAGNVCPSLGGCTQNGSGNLTIATGANILKQGNTLTTLTLTSSGIFNLNADISGQNLNVIINSSIAYLNVGTTITANQVTVQAQTIYANGLINTYANSNGSPLSNAISLLAQALYISGALSTSISAPVNSGTTNTSVTYNGNIIRKEDLPAYLVAANNINGVIAAGLDVVYTSTAANDASANTQANASGLSNSITLVAANDLTLFSSAQIKANGTTGMSGGYITLSAQQLNAQSGSLIQANGNNGPGGVIAINGTDIYLAGTVAANGSGNGGQGGSFAVTANTLTIDNAAVVQTNGQAGPGGTITLTSHQDIQINQAQISANGYTDGGSITIVSNAGNLNTQNALIQTNGSNGRGGSIGISAYSNVNINSTEVDATGYAQGGTIKIGNDASNGTLPFALFTSIDATSSINALQQDLNPSNRAGGYIETSGSTLNLLGSINAGRGGMWLIDPNSLIIDSTTATSIQSGLTANVTIQTTSGIFCTGATCSVSAYGSSGNISILSAITTSNSGTLKLLAAGSVVIDANISIGGQLIVDPGSNKEFVMGLNLSNATGVTISANGGFMVNDNSSTGIISYIAGNITTSNTAITFNSAVQVANFGSSSPISISSQGGNISFPGAVGNYSSNFVTYAEKILGYVYDLPVGSANSGNSAGYINTVSGSTTDVYIQYNSSGTFTVIPGISSIQYLVVGGGGGGGGDGGTGGGGGGFASGTTTVTQSSVISIVIGSGGNAGGWAIGPGTSGGASTITIAGTAYTANGGAPGGVGPTSSGGGGGISTVGYTGGAGGGNTGGVVGAHGTVGATGNASSITGSSTYYGGGGGGGVFFNSAQIAAVVGGAGGGGASASGNDASATVGGNGVANTGGGGGAGSASDASTTSGGGACANNGCRVVGGAGGSGVAIVRFMVGGSTDTNTPALSISSGVGSVTISSTVSGLTALSIISNNASNSISGVIAGATNLTFTGSGSTTLSANNTYTGSTTVNANATLNLTPSGNFSDTLSGGFVNNGTVSFDGSNGAGAGTGVSGIAINGASGSGVWNITNTTANTALWNNRFVLYGVVTTSGQMTVSNNGNFWLQATTTTGTNTTSAVNLNGANTYLRVYGVASGTIAIGTLTGSGVVDFSDGSGGTSLTLSLGNDGGSGTFSGVIKNSGASAGPTVLGLIKNGSGIQTLSGANTYSGGTTVSSGTLKVGNATALGASSGSTSVTSGAVLDLNGTTMTNTNALTLNGTGISSGGALTNSSATLATYAGAITLGSATSIGSSNGDITISAAIGGSSIALTKVGTDTVTLNAVNTYSGATTVSAGTLSVGGSGNLGSGTYSQNLTVASGATFTWASSASQTFSNLAAGTGIINLHGSGTNGTGNYVTISGDQAFTGTLNVYQNVYISGGTNDSTFGGLTKAAAINIQNGGFVNLFNTGSYNSNFDNSYAYNVPTTIYTGGTLYNGGSNSYHIKNITLAGGTLASAAASVWGTTLGPYYWGTFIFDGGLTVTADSTISATAVTLGVTVPFNVSSGATLTVSGTIVGAAQSYTFNGGLSITGAGLVVMSGANSYTGGTTISAGTLQVGNGGTTGTLGTGGVTNNSALVYNRSNSIADNNNISGSGTVTQAGSGILTLSGANTYTGGTWINAGTLNVGSSGAIGSTGTITFGDWTGGGILQYSLSNTTDYSSRFSSANSQAYSIDTNGQSVTLGSALTSTLGSLNKYGSGTLTLGGTNTYANGTGTTVFAGILQVSSDANLGGSVNAPVTLQGGALLASSSFATGRSLTVTGSGNILYVASGATLTINGTIFGSGGTLNLGGTATGGSYTGTLAYNPSSSSSLSNLNLYAGTLLGNSTVTNPSVVTVYAGTISAAAGTTFTFSNTVVGSATINIGDSTNTGTVALGATTNSFSGGVNVNYGTLSVSAQTNLPSGNTITLTNGGTLLDTANNVTLLNNILLGTGGGVIAVNGSTNTLTLSGTMTGTNAIQFGTSTNTGTIALTTNKAFTGAMSVSAATVNLSGYLSTTTIGISGNGTLAVTGGGVNRINQASVITVSNGTFANTQTGNGAIGQTMGAGSTINLNGNATVSLSGVGDTWGSISVQGLTINSTGSGNTITGGALAIYNTGLTISVASATSLTISSLMENSNGTAGLFTKTGAGTLILTGANTYTGGTTISTGTIQVGAGGTTGNLGTGGVVNNSALVYNRSDTLTDNNIISGAGTVAQAGTGTTTLGGANTYTGNTTVNAGTLANTSSGSSTKTVAFIINNGGTYKLLSTGGFPNNSTNGYTFVVNAGGTLDLNGVGWVDGGSTGYAIQLNGGTLANSSGTAATVTMSYSTTKDIVLAANSYIGGTGNITLNGVISGAYSLTNSNTGVVTLGGANTYSGGTFINAGTVQISSDGNLGAVPGSATTNVTINGGTLLTSGQSAAFTINANRGIAIGASGATINNANATYAVTVAGAISGSNTLIINSGSNTGTVILSNATNTYSGNTTINGGTLQVVSAGTLGSGSYAGNISIATGATFKYSSSAAETLSGAISGAGTLTKDTATSTLTVSNANTLLAGPVNVNAGTLALTNPSALGGSTGGLLSIGAAGTVDLQYAGTVNLASLSMVSGSSIVDTLGVAALVVNGTAVLGGSVHANWSQTYSGAVTLAANTSLTSPNSGIAFASTVDSVSGSNYALTVSNGSPNTFTAAVGGITPLSAISVSGPSNLFASVTTNGANGQLWSSDLTIGGNVTFASNNGPVTINGAISVAQGKNILQLTGSGAYSDTVNGVVTTGTAGSSAVTLPSGGGTLSYASGTGIYSWTAPANIAAQYLVVAGGGAGGGTSGSANGSAGGGGGGGVITGNFVDTTSLIFTASVGAGGSGSIGGTYHNGSGISGGNSTLTQSTLSLSASAIGGGGGGGYNYAGSSGGSGGGGGGNYPLTMAGGAGTSNQGNAGGSGTGYAAGGGGGAGAAGGGDAITNNGGNGGAGLASSITGTTVYYGAGGGGSSPIYGGSGGQGGGGNGGNGYANVGTNASGYGSGGGGTYISTGGGSGSSGIVILSSYITYTLAINAGSGKVTLVGNINSATANSNSGQSIAITSSNAASIISGSINGTSSVTFNGGSTGVLQLSGTNTYTGATNINGGTLSFSSLSNINSATGGLNLGGGTLLLTGTSNSVTLAGLVSLTAGTASGLAAASGNTLTVNGNIATSTGSLTIGNSSNTGTVILSGANAYTGGTTISGGTLQLGSAYVTTTSAVTNSSIGTGNITIGAGGTLDLNGYDLGASTQTSGIPTVTMSGTGTTASTQALLINSSASNLVTVYAPITLTKISATAGTLVDVIAQITNSTPATITVKGIISDGAGTNGSGLQVGQTGYLGNVIFLGANTYTGGTTISGGTLQVGNGGTTGSVGTGSIVNNGNLNYNLAASVLLTLPANAAYSGTGNLSATAGGIAFTGNLTIGGSFTYNATQPSGFASFSSMTSASATVTAVSASITGFMGGGASAVNAYTLTINTSAVNGAIAINNVTNGYSGTAPYNIENIVLNAGAGTISISGVNQFNAWDTTSTVTFTAGTISGSGTFTTLGGSYKSSNLVFNLSSAATLQGAIAGTGSLTKQGSGTLTLSVANAYTGATTVSGGTLLLGNVGALGGAAGAVSVASGAVLDLNGLTLTNTNPLTINGSGISNGGALTNSSATAATYAGAITLGSASSIGSSSGNISVTGAVGGNFVLTKSGSNTLTLNGINTFGQNGSPYSGAVISGGILQIGGSGTWTNTTANTLNIATGAVFQYSSSANSTVVGVISGGGSLIKDTSASSTLSFLSSNTFTGDTTIKAGILYITSAAGLGVSTNTLYLGDTSGANAAGLRVANTITVPNNIVLNTNGTLSILTDGNWAVNMSGNVTGNNNLVLNATAGWALTMSGSINNSGTIINNGAGSATNIISGTVGANVTGITQNSTTSALTISGRITTNANATTLTDSAGTLTITGGISAPSPTSRKWMPSSSAIGTPASSPTTSSFASATLPWVSASSSIATCASSTVKSTSSWATMTPRRWLATKVSCESFSRAPGT